MADDPLTPPFANKIAVVVRNDLEPWQRLNVTAFLMSGVTAAHPELVGEDYQDADGQQYLRLLGVPVRAVSSGDLDLVGMGLHGPKNAVDKVVKGARLHR